MKYIIPIILSIFSLSCNNYNIEEKQSDNNQEATNREDGNLKSVQLIRENTFGNNEKYLLEGYISDYEIDDNGRVYIVSSNMGQIGISVFDPEGNFIEKIGRKGRGPGDFMTIADIVIRDKLMHVFDSNLKRISIYDLDTYKLLRTVILSQNSSLSGLTEISMLHVTEEGFYVMGFMEPAMLASGEDRKMILYYRNNSGEFISSVSHTIGLPYLYKSDKQPGPKVPLPFVMPFSAKTVFDFTVKDELFTAWSNRFEIDVLDKEWELVTQISHNYSKPQLDIHSMGVHESRISVLRQYELPDTWPALYELVVSENQLWVAAFTEEYSEFKWFVFNESGELIANFIHVGKHDNIEPGMIPKGKFRIHKGYFYEHEFNYEQGIDRIVKSSVKFEDL